MHDGRRTARAHHQGRVRGVVAGLAALTVLLGGCGDTSDPAASDGAATTARGQATDDTAATTPAPDQADTTDSTEDDMDPSRTPIPVPGPALPSGPVPDSVVQNDDVQEAIAAEADRLGVDPEDVEVVGYATVTWSDGSLGCPKPGMMYTQALVPGRQLVLAVDGQQASYHAAAEGPFTYCARPTAPSGGGTAPSDM
ncbi:hypothetical protein [uncultured Ornithinimicrobium sp.]|uniref:hypothetical protein n=1 Tax=uncultured Ornithinimicrobium sp. TaxID=259307 RepID=UPI0025928BB6|nr:hypothetical protein [uncultured Ornithinimicrobium sp.]